jgi:CubicO group peptidase (beta-lactamase class C family)
MRLTTTTRTTLLALVWAAFTAGCSAPHRSMDRSMDRFQGRWDGVIGTDPGRAFSVNLQRDSAWHGNYSLPAQGLTDFPLADIRIADDSLVLHLMSGSAFEVRAVVYGDSISGTAFLPDGRHRVRLARAGTALAESIGSGISDAVGSLRARPLELVAAGPGMERVDRRALDELVAAAYSANSDALVVLHDGALVGEWHRDGASTLIETMSVTKAVLNLAIGRLISTGAIPSLDEPVHRYFADWSEGDRSRITLRHLLSHTSGLHSERTTGAIYASSDFVRHALAAPLVAEPGTAFFYNNNGTNLLAGVIGAAAGRPVDEFLRQDLFHKLGITDMAWQRDAAGNPHGMSGLQLHARDLARLGQLVLDRGRHGHEQLIDEGWFDQSLRPGSEFSADAGLLWWLLREAPTPGSPTRTVARPVIGYRADGYLGQYLVIFPAERLVGVRLVTTSPAYHPDTDGYTEFPAKLRRLARQE